MNTIIEQYRKQLLELAVYEERTAKIYISCIYKYVDFARCQFGIDPINTTPQHLKHWLIHLKKTNRGNSSLVQHTAALKGFFTFMMNMAIIDHNPTDWLFPIRISKSELNQPIDKDIAYQLLKSINRSAWIGQRNFMIISCLWALGLRRQELAHLKRKDFDPNYNPKHNIGLLIVHGKGRKQRALFVVDKLYHNLVNYLARPVSATHVKKHSPVKNRPIFPSKNAALLTGNHILKIVRLSEKPKNSKLALLFS